MNFSEIFQLRDKKFWWIDILFYFVIALFVSVIFCYIIFAIKSSILTGDIMKVDEKMKTVGTDIQKDQEKEVIIYQRKINSFTDLLKNHDFASNTFAFMEAQTMPNVWYKQFSLDAKGAVVQLSGESDNLDALSRQVASLEKNEYVKNIGSLNSSLGAVARSEFNVNIALNNKIFSYNSNTLFAEQAAAKLAEKAGTSGIPASSTPATETPATTPASANQTTGTTAGSPATGQPGTPAAETVKSSERFITAFHILSNPEIVGTVDNTKYTVNLDVPFGTNIKNLNTAIVISPGATIIPASGLPQAFTGPVTYAVTAQDGTVQAYKVTVNVLPAPIKKTNQSGLVALIYVISAVILVVAGATTFFIIRKRMQNKRESV